MLRILGASKRCLNPNSAFENAKSPKKKQSIQKDEMSKRISSNQPKMNIRTFYVTFKNQIIFT
jgi:hypothetical protein